MKRYRIKRGIMQEAKKRRRREQNSTDIEQGPPPPFPLRRKCGKISLQTNMLQQTRTAVSSRGK